MDRLMDRFGLMGVCHTASFFFRVWNNPLDLVCEVHSCFVFSFVFCYLLILDGRSCGKRRQAGWIRIQGTRTQGHSQACQCGGIQS
jgi:hypothetical protein